MAAANRSLQQQVKDLQSQLHKAAGLQAEALGMRQRTSQLEQQNSDLQQQLQSAARAWADKHKQHKEALAKAQAGSSETAAENRRLLGMLRDAEQVHAMHVPACVMPMSVNQHAEAGNPLHALSWARHDMLHAWHMMDKWQSCWPCRACWVGPTSINIMPVSCACLACTSPHMVMSGNMSSWRVMSWQSPSP